MAGSSSSSELNMNNDYARLAIEEEEDGGLIVASDEAMENGGNQTWFSLLSSGKIFDRKGDQFRCNEEHNGILIAPW